MDASINASVHTHAVRTVHGHHNALVRFQERLAAETTHRHRIEGMLHTALQMLTSPGDYPVEQIRAFVNDVREEGWVES